VQGLKIDQIGRMAERVPASPTAPRIEGMPESQWDGWPVRWFRPTGRRSRWQRPDRPGDHRRTRRVPYKSGGPCRTSSLSCSDTTDAAWPPLTWALAWLQTPWAAPGPHSEELSESIGGVRQTRTFAASAL
jgi:hypothetical protein